MTYDRKLNRMVEKVPRKVVYMPLFDEFWSKSQSAMRDEENKQEKKKGKNFLKRGLNMITFGMHTSVIS